MKAQYVVYKPTIDQAVDYIERELGIEWNYEREVAFRESGFFLCAPYLVIYDPADITYIDR